MDDAIRERFEALEVRMDERVERIEHAVFGNGQPGISEKLTRLLTLTEERSSQAARMETLEEGRLNRWLPALVGLGCAGATILFEVGQRHWGW